ncbi:acyl carrier protein [Piscinibacter sp.]|uniref:acyl carrier protein n=1 Tax=Piscinibacter sp. TaxID=1903157 RepID=UPI0039E65CD5
MPSSTSTFETVADVLRTQFETGDAPLEPATPLNALGLDSMSLMEFVFAVEDRFGLRIPEERLDPRQADLTLADLCKAIDEALAAARPAAA